MRSYRLRDKFGVSRQSTSTALMKMMEEPCNTTARKVMEAMLHEDKATQTFCSKLMMAQAFHQLYTDADSHPIQQDRRKTVKAQNRKTSTE